jgi:hypothetical protein
MWTVIMDPRDESGVLQPGEDTRYPARGEVQVSSQLTRTLTTSDVQQGKGESIARIKGAESCKSVRDIDSEPHAHPCQRDHGVMRAEGTRGAVWVRVEADEVQDLFHQRLF